MLLDVCDLGVMLLPEVEILVLPLDVIDRHSEECGGLEALDACGHAGEANGALVGWQFASSLVA